ncbi:MAG: glutathione peroxidase [Terrimesophilobacter sp.]
MDLTDIPLTTIDGESTNLSQFAGKAIMIVNVASRCGFTPQYAVLESLYKKYRDRGFTVLGFPSNQFMFQEPGSADEIKDFCTLNYGVTFPLFEKINVNGSTQHPLFAELTKAKDASGKAGMVKWNFEKFLVSPDGEVHRFRSTVTPDAPEIVDAIEKALPR